MHRSTAQKKNKKFEMHLAFLTLILFIAFVVTPFFCKMYLNENLNTVVGTVLGAKDTKTKVTKETIKEQVDKFFLNLIN